MREMLRHILIHTASARAMSRYILTRHQIHVSTYSTRKKCIFHTLFTKYPPFLDTVKAAKALVTLRVERQATVHIL